MRPAARMHADRGPQIHGGSVLAPGAHTRPPLEELGLPVLERSLQQLVARQIDIVRNLVGVGNTHESFFLDAIAIEFRLAAGAEYGERTRFADRVGTIENPVLP